MERKDKIGSGNVTSKSKLILRILFFVAVGMYVTGVSLEVASTHLFFLGMAFCCVGEVVAIPLGYYAFRPRYDAEEPPTHLKVLRVLFFISCGIAIAGISLHFKNDIANTVAFSLGMIFGLIAVFLGIAAFKPEVERMRLKKEQYIQKRTELLQEDIATREANINYRATKKRSRARSEGWRLENCPFCGDPLEGDEEFCNKCGRGVYLKCDDCETINAGNSKFCKKCGKEL